MRQLTAMIVDDERVIVDGFLKLVNWERLGMRVIATAYDGIMAENQILALSPDLVVMDINMPLLTGLEVIRRVSAERPATVYVIISGYDDFQYMREALQLRVYDYLLKPVDFEQFEQLVLRLRQEHFNKLEAQPEPDAEGHGVPMINAIVQHINEHYAEDLSLVRLAGVFYLHPNYLSQYFKSKTGTNYNTYLNSLRMERAKQLLRATDRSVAEIGAMVGCPDYRSFAKRFHKLVGVTPSEYRSRR